MANAVNTERLLKAKELAEMLSLSKRQIFRLKSSGKIPAPLQVGGSVRWRQSDIEQWLSLGCPERQEFEARKMVICNE